MNDKGPDLGAFVYLQQRIFRSGVESRLSNRTALRRWQTCVAVMALQVVLWVYALCGLTGVRNAASSSCWV